VTAVVADHNIMFIQGVEHTNRIRFLANGSVGGAEDHTLFKAIKHLFFKASDAYHLLVIKFIEFHRGTLFSHHPPGIARGCSSRAQAQ